jgi:hypothetical protein
MPVLKKSLAVYRPVFSKHSSDSKDMIPFELKAGTEYTITMPSEHSPGNVHIVVKGNPYEVLEEALKEASE